MEQARYRRFALYFVAVSALSLLLMGVVSIQYANYVDRKSKQQWCSIVTILDDAYSATPPSTPLGRKLAEEFHKLRTEFGCK